MSANDIHVVAEVAATISQKAMDGFVTVMSETLNVITVVVTMICLRDSARLKLDLVAMHLSLFCYVC